MSNCHHFGEPTREFSLTRVFSLHSQWMDEGTLALTLQSAETSADWSQADQDFWSEVVGFFTLEEILEISTVSKSFRQVWTQRYLDLSSYCVSFPSEGVFSPYVRTPSLTCVKVMALQKARAFPIQVTSVHLVMEEGTLNWDHWAKRLEELELKELVVWFNDWLAVEETLLMDLPTVQTVRFEVMPEVKDQIGWWCTHHVVVDLEAPQLETLHLCKGVYWIGDYGEYRSIESRKIQPYHLPEDRFPLLQEFMKPKNSGDESDYDFDDYDFDDSEPDYYGPGSDQWEYEDLLQDIRNGYRAYLPRDLLWKHDLLSDSDSDSDYW